MKNRNKVLLALMVLVLTLLISSWVWNIPWRLLWVRFTLWLPLPNWVREILWGW